MMKFTASSCSFFSILVLLLSLSRNKIDSFAPPPPPSSWSSSRPSSHSMLLRRSTTRFSLFDAEKHNSMVPKSMQQYYNNDRRTRRRRRQRQRRQLAAAAQSSASTPTPPGEYGAAPDVVGVGVAGVGEVNGSYDVKNGVGDSDGRWRCPQHQDVCRQTGVTLSRYMLQMARANPELTDIESIVTSLQTACKTISSLVRRSSLTGLTGLEGGGGAVNAQGEEQKKLDVITNDVLKKALQWSGKLATLASEEEEVPVLVDNFGNTVYSGEIVVEQEGRYVAVFDPLDGSSNVDANIPTGTIFGIFASDEECQVMDDETGELYDNPERKCIEDAMQPGKNLVAAGYCLYSSATTLVFTLGCGVNGFTLDETIGEFRLTHPDMKIPARGNVYSFNEANRWMWDDPLQEYITAVQKGVGETGKRYTARYIGSMVGDVHRTLLYGGIFGYPADAKNPDGKLRLLYEAAPMSFLVEQAGGLALTGKTRIMDIQPSSVHQRVPCILGSPEDVTECRTYYEASDDPTLAARCAARLAGGHRRGGGEVTTTTTTEEPHHDGVAVDAAAAAAAKDEKLEAPSPTN